MLPQRRQRWREPIAVVDSTIPHEHSSTGMAKLRWTFAEIPIAVNKKMYSNDRWRGKGLAAKAGKPCVAR
jgi:hypothetical protein